MEEKKLASPFQISRSTRNRVQGYVQVHAVFVRFTSTVRDNTETDVLFQFQKKKKKIEI